MKRTVDHVGGHSDQNSEILLKPAASVSTSPSEIDTMYIRN